MLQIKTTAGEAMYETRGDYEAPKLILFHTLLADCSVYDGIIDRLAENFCVTRFHFPGYGGSTGECNSIDDYADWTAAFFQALKLSEKKNTKFELVDISKPVEKVLSMARKFL